MGWRTHAAKLWSTSNIIRGISIKCIKAVTSLWMRTSCRRSDFGAGCSPWLCLCNAHQQAGQMLSFGWVALGNSRITGGNHPSQKKMYPVRHKENASERRQQTVWTRSTGRGKPQGWRQLWLPLKLPDSLLQQHSHGGNGRVLGRALSMRAVKGSYYGGKLLHAYSYRRKNAKGFHEASVWQVYVGGLQSTTCVPGVIVSHTTAIK